MTNQTLFAPKAIDMENENCRISQLSPMALNLISEFFKILSEGSRLHILCALRSGSKNVSEIISATGLGQANVSKHLKMLAQSGIVARNQQGINVYYQISNPFVFELCDLVCDALSVQIQQQNQHLQHLKEMQKNF